ncbi:sigma-54-dependent transcriptional regulator [Neptunomonas japonica]|uniref:Two-component system, NtrC family, C4-dicarboxylate transport response regulator DctD n=1 Tax=Neptunomonas japonica JAMM 1380 TaxID=1441457 RepID=A0A7R6PJV9_9GAMM|nr:sigma-54 dependent transcriptional regulator [Neptunomonas japonica]BBB30471.1 two-component system, NtrC family, C4-dicarboxylate transport response regulator DctD [Neptunomonas japonica JAMM 1380]
MSSAISNGQVIIIDDEEIVRESMIQTLQLEGYHASAYENPQRAIEQCSMNWQGVIICDVRMDIMGGLEVLQLIIEVDPEIPVIMFSGHSDIAIAIQAIRLGAYDFLEKTDDPQQHINTVQRAWKKRQLVLENRSLRQAIQGQHEIDNRLIGQTKEIIRLRETTLQLAHVDVDLIINGATGTGKEVVANCLHDFSPRAKKPFVALNCGAVTESIIESELFGHEVGAFTGANKKRIGKIEYASGGTLFLDEIESMPASLQVRLLRVLQERTLQRLGGNADIDVDIRVIAASKVNLRDAADQGQFREDLYYRLNVASIEIPNLDQRKEDIPVLFSHFVDQATQRFDRESRPLPKSLLQQLRAQSWPGNVRELRNAAERWTLGLSIEAEADTHTYAHTTQTTKGANLDELVDHYEREVIAAALRANNGQAELTAEALGIPRKKLYLRMKKHGLERNDFIDD